MSPGTQRLRIVVSGLAAQYPLGGVTWDYLQYPLGLARLGHDVYYVEDTGQCPYDPIARHVTNRCDYSVRYLAAAMERFGLADRWAYYFDFGSRWFGMTDARRREVVETADLFINVSFALGRVERYRTARRLVCIDSDPVFTQVKLARGQHDFRKVVDAHDVHFSFGERLTAKVPSSGHHWLPTRQPVVLSEWAVDVEERPVFTTVMNWSSYKPITFQGRSYGQKDAEFPAFLDLPQRVRPTVLELAVPSQGKTSRLPAERLREHGWQVVDPEALSTDLDSYRAYICASRAEWSVAKGGYVIGQPGWFSCRSACYLAAGRPVVVQDTGFSSVLPTGLGLLAFTDLEEAVAGIHAVESDYARHSGAARALAAEYFDSSKVLTRLVDDAMATTRAHARS